MDQVSQRFWELVQECQRPEFWIPAVSACGGAVVMLVVLFALVWFVRRRRAGAVEEEPQLASIDAGAWRRSARPQVARGLPSTGTPVRLTILAIAPVGRDSHLPDALEIPALMDQLVPGMKLIMESHHPEIVCWPSQLSSPRFCAIVFPARPAARRQGPRDSLVQRCREVPRRGGTILRGWSCAASATTD